MAPNTTEQPKIPQIIYLVGGGRHSATKQLRRAARFERRVFQIGGIPIRPNRRKDVNAAFVAKHVVEILSHVADGTLIVQHRHDRFMDTDEIKALVARVKGETIVQVVKEEKPVTLPAPPQTDELEEVEEVEEVGQPNEPVDEISEPDEDASHDEPSEPEELVAAEVVQDEPVQVVSNEVVQEAQEIPEAVEPAATLMAAEDALQERLESEEAPVDVEEPAEAVSESADAESGADVQDTAHDEADVDFLGEIAGNAEPEGADASPDVQANAQVEPEAPKRSLPAEWTTLPKKELLKLCAERKIMVDANRASNKKLIDLLQGWLLGT